MNEKEILTLIKKNIHTDMYLRNTCMQCLVSKAKEGDTKMIFGKPYKLSGESGNPLVVDLRRKRLRKPLLQKKSLNLLRTSPQGK